MNNKKIVVMGVSGCGKSHIGHLLAQSLNYSFFDGDDFHPQSNVDKMRQGIPLTDEDRVDWLHTLNQLLIDNESAVIACSALKPEYRDILRINNEDLTFIYLQGEFETIWQRHQKRDNHWFNGKSMLESQFDTLVEPMPNEAIFIDITPPVETVLHNIQQKLKQGILMSNSPSSNHSHIAMIGLGVMGKSLTLNLLDNQFNVAGFDINEQHLSATSQEAQQLNKGSFLPCNSLSELLNSLKSPRVVALSIPAGNIVEQVIDDLLKSGLEPQDIVIDTGNSLWTDTIAREAKYQGKLQFFSTAVSGGEQGARFGPALMASGSEKAWQSIKPMWNAIAAKVDSNGLPVPPLHDGEPCATYTGPSGSGHFVKMVHNGIEYADMQLICEVYHYLRSALQLPPSQIGDIFTQWNKGILNSYLIEITADILKQQDFLTEHPLVDMILDKAGQKGTGTWTAINSLEIGCPTPTITQSVYARSLSSLKSRRLIGAQCLKAKVQPVDKTNPSAIINELHDALYCAKLCAYAQGFDLMKATSEQQNWQLNFVDIAKGWRAGCIIRATFLQDIANAYQQTPKLDNLLFADHFAHQVENRQLSWRKTVSNSSLHGIPMPGISSALNYFDSMNCETLPANLLQAQRDFFGSHTYSRIDQPESNKYHVEWGKSPRIEVKR